MPLTLTGNKADFSDALMRAKQDGLIVRNGGGANRREPGVLRDDWTVNELP